MITGLIAGPFLAGMLVDCMSVFPNRLVKLQENDDLEEFNNFRDRLKQVIVLEVRSYWEKSN